MNRAWWILFLTVLLSVWNAGIVWFTQVAVYPLWPLVDGSRFHDYHLAWWHAMWPAFRACRTHADFLGSPFVAAPCGCIENAFVARRDAAGNGSYADVILLGAYPGYDGNTGRHVIV